MKELTAFILLVCLAGCRPAQNGSVAIPEIETLAATGYRGPIVVSGYYYHSEQDAIYQKPQPDDHDRSHVLLQMALILERAKITDSDWLARRRFMQSFDRQLVTVTGELKREVFHVGGLQPVDPTVLTFVRVEKIERANQRSEGTPGKSLPSIPSQPRGAPHP